MIRLYHLRRWCGREWKKILWCSLWRPRRVGIADSFRDGKERRGFGQSRGSSNSSTSEVKSNERKEKKLARVDQPKNRAKLTDRLAERLFEGVLEARGEELGGPIGDDGHDFLAADAKFTGDVDAGLVREGHAGL